MKESAGNDSWRIEGVVRDEAMALVKNLYWMETELQLAEPSELMRDMQFYQAVYTCLACVLSRAWIFMSKTGFRMLEKIIFDDQFCALTFLLTFTNYQN